MATKVWNKILLPFYFNKNASKINKHINRYKIFSRSPDMTPVDFWLWSYVKTLVYQDELSEDEGEAEREVIARLHAAFATIDPEMVQRATSTVAIRARKCLDAGGNHFQQQA